MGKKMEYPVPVRFEKLNEKLIAGLQITLGADAPLKIPKLWEQFNSVLPKIPSKKGSVAYGLCSQSEKGMEYLCGIEVDNADSLPDNLTFREIPATRFAVFSHNGHVSTLRKTMDDIWGKAVPNGNFEVVESGFFFERYGEEFNPKTGKGGIEVWIPVK